MYDNKTISEREILRLNQELQNSISGINNQLSITSNKGSVTTNINIPFNRIISEYIKIYGIPKKGVGIDTFRYQEIYDELVSQDIDPFSFL